MTIDYEICTELFHPLCLVASTVYQDGQEPERAKLLMERIRGKQEPDLVSKYTADEEYAIINEQIKKTQGFDVDFSMFRRLFNFYPAFLDENYPANEPDSDDDEDGGSYLIDYMFPCRRQFLPDGKSVPINPQETDRVYFDKFTKEAIVGYNQREGTSFEFVKVEKVNVYRGNTTYTYFITFLVKDPCDSNQAITFQAKVRNVLCREIVHDFCRPKPVNCDEDSEKVAKKPRYT